MRTFSATVVTIAGLVLALAEFAIGATELPGLLGEDTYAIVAFVLGAIGVACTVIIRGQITQPTPPPVAPEPEQPEQPEAGDHE